MAYLNSPNPNSNESSFVDQGKPPISTSEKGNTISIAATTGVAGSGTGSQLPEPGNAALHKLLGLACSEGLRVAVLAVFLAYSFVLTACRARGNPWDLSFVVGAYAGLVALFCCLRRAERLTPESPAGERRRLQVAVWALSAALSCAFAYRLSRVMPAALVVAIWCMTAAVVLLGLYLLVFFDDSQHHHYYGLEHYECDGGDGKTLGKKILSEEIV